MFVDIYIYISTLSQICVSKTHDQQVAQQVVLSKHSIELTLSDPLVMVF